MTLVKDLEVRWNTTHDMLERAVSLKRHILEWTRRYTDYRPLCLDSEEWRNIQDLIDLLAPFKKITMLLSEAGTPTASKAFLIYNSLFTHVDAYIPDEDGHVQLETMISPDVAQAGFDKLNEFYRKTEGPGGFYFNIATILDPTNKLKIYEDPDWEPWAVKYKESFEAFIAPYTKDAALEEHSDLPIPSSSTTSSRPFTLNAMFRAKHQRDLDHAQHPMGEVRRYLAEAPIHDQRGDFNLLHYWRHRATEFPGLARAAREIFSIVTAEVAVERLFSIGRDVIPYRRGQLGAARIEALIFNRYYRGPQHTEALLQDLPPRNSGHPAHTVFQYALGEQPSDIGELFPF